MLSYLGVKGRRRKSPPVSGQRAVWPGLWRVGVPAKLPAECGHPIMLGRGFAWAWQSLHVTSEGIFVVRSRHSICELNPP